MVGHDGKVLAGGQSLIPILNMRLASPAHLVDINLVAGLDTVTVSGTGVRVGATVRHAELERDAAAYAALPLLRQALVNVAHPAIRNRGTTVGSIAHADAAGEMPAVLALTDGAVEVASSTGRARSAWQDLFLGALETSVTPEEIVVAARFGAMPPGTGTAFLERARRHGDYAMAGVGRRRDASPTASSRAPCCRSCRSPTCPWSLDVTEAFAGRETRADRLVAAATDAVHAAIDPEGDIHATAEYRAMLAVELTRLALAHAAAARRRRAPLPPTPRRSRRRRGAA